jgi:hypothetical protein
MGLIDEMNARRLLKTLLVVLVVCVAVGFLVFYWGVVGAWLAVHLGITNEAGSYYAFWSAPGSDISEVAILGGLYGMLRHLNCHAPRCWRLGKHPTADGTFKLCPKHHPEVGTNVSLADIHAAHYAARKN